MDKQKIAMNLKSLRGNTSQAEVARAIGITPAAMTNYEQGIRIPRDEVKKKIAEYYGVTVESIFFN